MQVKVERLKNHGIIQRETRDENNKAMVPHVLYYQYFEN